MKSRTVAAAEFRNACLKLMEEVRKHRVPLTVTRRGKPLVRIVPVSQPPATRTLVGTIVHEAEEIFSTGETWEAER